MHGQIKNQHSHHLKGPPLTRFAWCRGLVLQIGDMHERNLSQLLYCGHLTLNNFSKNSTKPQENSPKTGAQLAVHRGANILFFFEQLLLWEPVQSKKKRNHETVKQSFKYLTLFQVVVFCKNTEENTWSNLDLATWFQLNSWDLFSTFSNDCNREGRPTLDLLKI